MIRLTLLGIFIVIVMFLITSCSGGQKQTSQPTSTPPSNETQGEATQPEQGKQTEAPEGVEEQPKPQLGKGTELPSSESLPGIISEASIIQHIWVQFQKEQGKLRSGQDLSSWMDNTIAQFDDGEKVKDDSSLKAYIISLLRICLNDPQNSLCSAPWELVRYEIPIYKKTLAVNQFENSKQQFTEILKAANYVALTQEEIADTAPRMVGLLFGDISCQLNFCLFDDVFPRLSRLSDEIKHRLFADLLRPLERLAIVQQWQLQGEVINVVIKTEG